MPSVGPGPRGQQYWRSLDELADTPEFRQHVEREFAGIAPDLLTHSRRGFLKVMGASLALAGMAGCRWPKETIVPFTKNIPGRLAGVPVQYATAFELSGVGTGLLVSSYDGRPVKIDGNDEHPFSRRATNSWMQAVLLEMYDPDRSVAPQHSTGGARKPARMADFQAFIAAHFRGMRESGGAGLCVLAESSSSPTLADAKARFLSTFPKAVWFEYEPVSRDAEAQGTRLAFGRPFRPQYRLDRADVLLCLDADLLLTHPASLRWTRDFASRRTAADEQHTMNRLYAIESRLTLTGSNADHRYALRASDLAVALCQIVEELGKAGVNIPVRPTAPTGRGLKADVAAAIAADLLAHKGRSLVAVGADQPAALHALACMINTALGNDGQTLSYIAEPGGDRPSHVEAIATLAGQMAAGEVSTLLMLGGNPLHDAPADLDFAAALARVQTSIHLSLHDNETSRACTWHAPRAHFLESWGDTLAWDGTYSIIQPLIAPLYDGMTTAELTALASGDATGGYDLTRRTFGERFAGDDFESRWRQALHDGLVKGSAAREENPALATAATEAVARQVGELLAAAPSGVDVIFSADSKVYDGRFANNGWLQELPDPLTKLTWDNAVQMSPSLASRLGVTRPGQRVTIELAGRSLTAPAMVVPGHAADSVTLTLGYGRGRAAGVVADGAGFNAYPLRTRAAWTGASGATLRTASGVHTLVSTQDHHAIRSAVGDSEIQRRVPELVREGTLADYRAHPDFAQHVGPHFPLRVLPSGKAEPVQLFNAQEHPDKQQWALAVDLSRCTGCSACVVACQAENNIPVVGKEEVHRGREMHWMRIDRYFLGEPEAPQVTYQPMTCHQCENAPCEQVCPVAATVHDSEGLNVMVYNRCIGTRYCSNNCPYKVRRFNWFFNHHGPYHPRSIAQGTVSPGDPKQPGFLKQQHYTEIQMLGMNPGVTVRSRGVMEKCTFCVQRIMNAKIRAHNERRTVRDGEIITACAEACPAEALVFGDRADRESRVARLFDSKASPRGYFVLEELNVRPRLKYQAKLRNPLVALAGESKKAGDGHGGHH